MSYWQERLAQAQQKLTSKSIKATEAQLRKYYNRTMSRVIKEFEATYNKLYNTTVRDNREATPADLYRLDAYWKLQTQMRNELKKLGDRQAVLFSKSFEEHWFEIYYSFALDGGEAFSNIDSNIVQTMINAIWCADGKSWSNRVWENTERLQEALNEGLIECVLGGRDEKYLKKDLMERFQVSYNRADSLVRTELAHIQTQAAQQRYKDYGLEEVEVFVDEDEKTCPICSKHEGERYKVGSTMPIPFHPRCRCCVIPVID